MPKRPRTTGQPSEDEQVTEKGLIVPIPERKTVMDSFRRVVKAKPVPKPGPSSDDGSRTEDEG